MADAMVQAAEQVGATVIGTVDIVTDVVKIRIASHESASRILRLSSVEEILGCTAELLSRRISTEPGRWHVSLIFRASIEFIDRFGNERTLRVLIFFTKNVPFPIGCLDCADLTPRVEVTDVLCNIIPLLHTFEVVVDFNMIVKALLREEITVLTPEG